MAAESCSVNGTHLSPFSSSDCIDRGSSRLVIGNATLLPSAIPVPFSSFNNKYAGGSCHVVGRGPTDFDYSDLTDLDEPAFFINDAICLEKHVRSETFFFAHDAELRPWLDGSIRATAVLPVNGTILLDAPGLALAHAGPVVYYHRRQQDGDLLRMCRDELADRNELFGHTGTIHPLIHFVWFCGFRRIVFIGCDGINRKNALTGVCGAKRGYDRRLQNRSDSSSGPYYAAIRRAQDLLTTLFGLEAIYRGTPVLPELRPVLNAVR